MESGYGDVEENTEDIPGHKKSRLKTLKSRLFGKSKTAGGEVNTNFSQSASDITAGQGLRSDEDLVLSQGMMGSRAFSHDSIFLADEGMSDIEPVRILSQENVHSKIKALQMKLQLQKMHLGPPPLVLPVRRQEDLGANTHDGGFPHGPTEMPSCCITNQRTLGKTLSQPSSQPLSPVKLLSTTSVPVPPSHTSPLSTFSTSTSSYSESPLDFSSPAQFTPCLDTSAARHRMSVKPRNQRASSRKRPDSGSYLDALNIHHPEPVKEEEQLCCTDKAILSNDQDGAEICQSSKQAVSKFLEEDPVTTEGGPESSNLSLSQADNVIPSRLTSLPSQLLRVKPHRKGNMCLTERPHSSFIQSEWREKSDDPGDFQIRVKSSDQRHNANKAGMAGKNSKEDSSDQPSASFGTTLTSRLCSIYDQVQGETENTQGMRRYAAGSGSFHFSITSAKSRDWERPRTSSFVGVLQQTGAGQEKTGGDAVESTPANVSEKEEHKDVLPTDGAIAVGRVRQEQKGQVFPWERQDFPRKVELVTQSKNLTIDARPSGEEETQSNRELVEEAVEAKEEDQVEDSKTVFGCKLRSTSQSMRIWSDPSKPYSKLPLSEGPKDQQKPQEDTENAPSMNTKLPAYTPRMFFTSDDDKLTTKQNSLTNEDQTATSKTREVETTQEAQPAPQTSPEMSWMTLAMEKTRSIHQLFTSRFPRDFVGGQASRVQPETQPAIPSETLRGAQVQKQTQKLPQNTTATLTQMNQSLVKEEAVQNQSQTVKSSVMTNTIQKTAPSTSSTFKEPEMSKHINAPQLHTNTTKPASDCQTAGPTNPWTSQSPLRTSSLIETSQLGPGNVPPSHAQSNLSSGQQQWAWNNRTLNPINQPKSTTSALNSVPTTSTAVAPSSLSAPTRGEKTASQEKETLSPFLKRTVFTGSVSEKAAFLEKQAEWTTLSGTKEVELKKPQTEVQASGESPASVRKLQITEGRQGIKPPDSSPTKIPDRPRDEKWLRKNMSSSLSPSMSPTIPSALQAMSDSDQPSWMELAKRKSMAWSDKTMD